MTVFVWRIYRASRLTHGYRLIATDSAERHSDASQWLIARPFDAGVRKGVEGLTARFDSKRNAVTLSWKYTPAPGDDVWFVIYRSIDGAPIAQYRSVEHVMSYEDTKLHTDGRYAYAVKVMVAGGAESAISKSTAAEVSRSPGR